jgi:hypothetical protein
MCSVMVLVSEVTVLQGMQQKNQRVIPDIVCMFPQIPDSFVLFGVLVRHAFSSSH